MRCARFRPLLEQLLPLLRLVRHSNLLIPFAQSHDSIVEGDIRSPAPKLMDFKRSRGFRRHIQSLAVRLWSEEHMVLIGSIDGLREIGIEPNDGRAVAQLPAAEILEPVLRSFDSV